MSLRSRHMRLSGLTLAVAAAGAQCNAYASNDFGADMQQLLKARSLHLFGVAMPLEGSAPATNGAYRTPAQTAAEQVLLARGLTVEYLTRQAANATDMLAFYPAAHPTHLITCVEGGRAAIGTLPSGATKYNPSVQRIDLTTGHVETVVRGMSACDGIRTTAWGTILATEERSDGGAYEILDPLHVTEQTVLNRATGENTAPTHIAKRAALPTMAWEGIAVLPNGVVYAGDELRPGTGAPDADGGALFKFIPTVPRPVNAAPISSLAQSPLAAGSVYALRVSCVDNAAQYGQGCEVGKGGWVLVNAATARAEADAKGATGYYRPEDLHQDLVYHNAAQPLAARFCWTNTGNEDASNYGEVMCAVDDDPASAASALVANRLIEGDMDFNSFDNLEFQPRTGIAYVIEDHDNGDIFACLRDGADRDIKSDGCVKILSVKDSSAEPTGFIFSPDGRTAYLSIQHSDDSLMSKHDGYATDDVLRITGFR